ncbi:hypothetical protein BGP77_02990 [Saccharospirillum sp. MSK14-1]|nr:hypothetical protein BGP77_02990 [Saccharospirillum sp. MSK14-1]
MKIVTTCIISMTLLSACITNRLTYMHIANYSGSSIDMKINYLNNEIYEYTVRATYSTYIVDRLREVERIEMSSGEKIIELNSSDISKIISEDRTSEYEVTSDFTLIKSTSWD